MSTDLNINTYIDHTILKSDATQAEVKKICDEAKEYQFASVCVNPTNVAQVVTELKGSGVKACCVVGFPLGATPSAVKAFETERVIALGAQEVDMVINIGAAKDGDWDLVESDIAAVVTASEGKALVKVIIETCLLTDEEKVRACECAKSAGAGFVKTSTGFSTGGATEADVKLMRQAVGQDIGVKASGGIKSYEDAVKMIKAGATRLGTSSGVKIMNGQQGTGY